MRTCELVVSEEPSKFDIEKYCHVKETWPWCPAVATMYVKLKSQTKNELPIMCCQYHAEQFDEENILWQESMR